MVVVAVAAARIPPASHISRVLLLILRWQYCSSATTEKPSLSKLLSILYYSLLVNILFLDT